MRLPGFGSAYERSGDIWTDQEVLSRGDRRTPVRDTTKVPFRWICHLEIVFQDSRFPGGEVRAFGSGVLIGSRHVLTAAHSLYYWGFERYGIKTPLRAARIRVTPGKNRAEEPFGSSQAVGGGLFYPDEWAQTLTTPPQWGVHYDFGVIKLRDAIGEREHKVLKNSPLGYWGSGERTVWEAVDPEKLISQKIMTTGYPGDKCGYDPILKRKPGDECKLPPGRADWKSTLTPKMLRCMETEGLMATAQFGSPGRVTNTEPSRDGPLVLLDTDTCKGMSGSPVWTHSGKTRALVAVLTGSEALTETAVNRAVPMSARIRGRIQQWMRA